MSTHRLPPEWAPQQAVLFTWPHPLSDWSADLENVDTVYVAMVEAVCRHQQAIISCFDHDHREHIRSLLAQASVDEARYRLFLVPSNDSWVRDHGPITLYTDTQLRLLDFRFNGWGGKYPHELDNRVSRALHAAGAFGSTPIESLDWVLEGGSIETDGAGTLLTTRQCLLSPKRNPDFDEAHWERLLKQHFGLEQVLWLSHGHLEGDDTDGHIDTLARFCDAHTIAYVQCRDRQDSHYEPLQAMERELQGFCDSHARPYRLVPLPLPASIYDEDGRRLPATYANFLIINDALLMPTYRDPLDELACEIIAGCFPGRSIIPIDALPLIRQNGSIHCATMQLPAFPG